MKFKPKAPPSDGELIPPAIPKPRHKPKLSATVKMHDPTDRDVEFVLENLEKFRFEKIDFEFEMRKPE